jgi:carboxymuconolactone decarboxylase family protein
VTFARLEVRNSRISFPLLTPSTVGRLPASKGGAAYTPINVISLVAAVLVRLGGMATERLHGLVFHLSLAKENAAEEESIEAITHLALYAGRPKAMSAMAVAKQVFRGGTD